MRMKFCMVLLMLGVIITAGNGQVQVMLPDTTTNGNNQISIPVRVSDATSYEVYSYQFTLNFNGAILKPVKLETEKTLTATWPTPVMNNATTGTVIIGGYGAYKLVGSGRLVNIVFDVIGQPDQVSNLNFTAFLFNNGNPTASTVNGRVKVATNRFPVTITTSVLDGTEVIVDGASFPAPYSTSWEKGSQHQISAPSPQTIGGNRKYSFQSWSDQGAQTHTVSVSAPTTFTATYSKQYYLTVQSNYGTPQGSGWYNAGATAQFSVEATVIEGGTTKRVFSSWTGTGAGSYSGTSRESSVVMNGPITETANWNNQYYVDISSPHGNPFGTGWYASGSAVNFGIDSTTINRAREHHKFLSWTGSGAGSYSGANSKATITISAPITEKANWDSEFLVETGSAPEGILQVPGAGWYKKLQQFTSIKAPASVTLNQVVHNFKGWKVNDQPVPDNPVTVIVDEPKQILADYNAEATVMVTTSVGAGTKVIVDGQEKVAPHTTSWLVGSKHSIGVVTVQNGQEGIRYLYRRWSHGGSQNQDVTATTNVTYTAELETQYYLDVKDEPAGIVNPKLSNWFPALQTVKLDSLPQSKLQGETSFRLKKWRIDGDDSLKTSVLIVMDKPHTAVAVYQQGFYISGNVTFIGVNPQPVTFRISGTEDFIANSDSEGNYLIAGLLTGDYTIRPTSPVCRFEPTERVFSIANNEEYQYFVAFYDPNSVQPDDGTDFMPDKFQIWQNHPNPFSDQTIIEYQLQRESNVTLIVYNVLGQVVKQLVNFQQPIGRHRIEWNRTDFMGGKVPQGVYFYRIEAGNFVQIRKMIVL